MSLLAPSRTNVLTQVVAAPPPPVEVERDLPALCSVSLVIPAVNEAENIGWVLSRVPAFVNEVILVDGESTDATVAVAREVYPDVVVVSQPRRGKGAALRAGFAMATCDAIVMIDADGSMAPAEIWRFVALLQSGFDLVKGSRFMAGGGSSDITPVRRWGNRALTTLVNQLYSVSFTDLCYGFFAFKRRCLPDLALAADGFEIETEIAVRAVLAGLRVCEAPSHESCRLSGESNLHAISDGRRVLGTLLRERLTPGWEFDLRNDAVIDLTDVALV